MVGMSGETEIFLLPYEGKTYIQIRLRNYSFLKRIWIATKYVFGYKCKFGHFDQITLNQEIHENSKIEC